MPERFVWHAFLGLCDGLAYLLNGRSYYDARATSGKWYPILHRDIKPDNVLLRSRSTISSDKYFYVVINDFGLACEELQTPGRPIDQYQLHGTKIGSIPHHAPELLWEPWPMHPSTFNKFPPGAKHSRQSDLYALGVSSKSLHP